VTSFANAIGGHLVIGMKESETIPTNLCGQDIASLDDFKQKIDGVLQTKVSPRVPSYGVQPIPLSDGSGKYAVADHVRRFRVERLANVLAGDTPVTRVKDHAIIRTCVSFRWRPACFLMLQITKCAALTAHGPPITATTNYFLHHFFA
jgi:hypothetical protein